MKSFNRSRRGPLLRPSVQFDETTITRFAGLFPFFHFVEEHLDLGNRLRVASHDDRSRVFFPIHHVFLAFMAASLVGVHKLAHLELLRHDRGLQKLSRLQRWPSRKVFATALDASDQTVQGLRSLLTDTGCSTISGEAPFVLDFDTTALLAFGEQEGTCFGFNGKGRNRRRYHPIVATIAETTAVVNADFRDGTAIKAEEYTDFILDSIKKVREHHKGPLNAVRADSGFFSHHFVREMTRNKIPFAVVLPMYQSLKLLVWKTQFNALEHDKDVELAVVPGPQLQLGEEARVVVVRRRIHDPKAPPLGKKVSGDAEWRYQAIATTLPEEEYAPYDVWNFYNHRAEVERVFRDGKGELGLDWLVSQQLRGNETAFLLRLLALNVDRLFHQHANHVAKGRGQKERRLGLGYRQTRLYTLPGRLMDHGGVWLLRLPPNQELASIFRFYDTHLRSGC